MPVSAENPLIIQGDGTVLVDVHAPRFEKARSAITPFSELEKSPEHMHTYRISSLSLWNAASAGITADEVIARLAEYARYPVPEFVQFTIRDTVSRFGKLVLRDAGDGCGLLLEVGDTAIRAELSTQKKLEKYLLPRGDGFYVPLIHRGSVKQELLKIGYPVKDEAPIAPGEPLEFGLRSTAASGRAFRVRDYQIDAARSFVGENLPGTGFGTIVLPCGSGKTIVGMAVMAMLKMKTLIVTTNVAAAHQWIAELLDKTTLTGDQIGEYSGDRKEIRPVTVATYQILTWRGAEEGEYPHFGLFRAAGWGLVIYDEVHMLPAPIFRVTAEIQSMRRLGLTATLVREDGREDEVFSLVGPKRYDVPWKELEAKGWIAEAVCREIRVDLPEELRVPYAVAEKRLKHRLASENPLKPAIVRQLVARHADDQILIIGQYLKQLDEIAANLDAPLITGQTPNPVREKIYAAFREGTERVIVVSKVANFAIDLPDASVAIQISGSFGSRQEEAQRLGRILRPKERSSFFYSIVSRYTVEETFSVNRQKFLTEQGYKYRIEEWEASELT